MNSYSVGALANNENNHAYSTCWVCVRYCLNHLYQLTYLEIDTFIIPIYWWENWGTERLNHLYKVIELVVAKWDSNLHSLSLELVSLGTSFWQCYSARILYIISIKQINRRSEKQLAQSHVGKGGTWTEVRLIAESTISTTRLKSLRE